MAKHTTPKAPPTRRGGPRTPEGKARSSLNATKHGIYARSVIPPSLARYEDPAEWDELLADLRQHLAPVGPLEGMLVEHIASFHWRLSRLQRAEGGAVSQAQEQAGAANERRAELLAIVHRDSAAIEGALHDGDLDALRAILDPQGIYPSCEGPGLVAVAHEQLQRNHVGAREQEIVDPFSACDRASLPFADEALKLARYEAHLQRQLHRAIATLERLQSARAAAGRPADPALSAEGTVGGHSARQPAHPAAGSRAQSPAAAPSSIGADQPGGLCSPGLPTHSPGRPLHGQPAHPGATVAQAQSPHGGSAAPAGGTVGGNPAPPKHKTAKRTRPPTLTPFLAAALLPRAGPGA